jgi:SpoVK/Ycf46/Vps4 family AAA+-type ATPase
VSARPFCVAERKQIADRTANYSGADLRALCGDAAMGPIRELPPDQIQTIDVSAVRPVNYKDLREACERTRPSVGAAQVAELERWNSEFGSFASQ